MATEPEDTETPETETSSLGDEWQWISNDTAEVLRATVEIAFTADPRKNWSAEELARWIRDEWLVDTGITGMRPVSSPMASRDELYSNMTTLPQEQANLFQSRHGSLQYYAKETRPDIAGPVNMVAQFCKEPTVGA